MMSGDEFYDDEITSGLFARGNRYPISGPGLESSGVATVRAADGPVAGSSDGGSPETERTTGNVSTPDRIVHRDCAKCCAIYNGWHKCPSAA